MKWIRVSGKYVVALALILVAWAQTPVAAAESYDEAVAQWKSYKDVGEWLDKNFKFSKERQDDVLSGVAKEGPTALRYRSPSATFVNKTGYCVDAAKLALDSLGKINPEYNPRWIFIKNAVPKKAHHWVTGFTVEGKLYVMDYGAGPTWKAMIGVHGPYDSLEDFGKFMSRLDIKGFKFDSVEWRDFPGKED